MLHAGRLVMEGIAADLLARPDFLEASYLGGDVDRGVSD